MGFGGRTRSCCCALLCVLCCVCSAACAWDSGGRRGLVLVHSCRDLAVLFCSQARALLGMLLRGGRQEELELESCAPWFPFARGLETTGIRSGAGPHAFMPCLQGRSEDPGRVAPRRLPPQLVAARRHPRSWPALGRRWERFIVPGSGTAEGPSVARGALPPPVLTIMTSDCALHLTALCFICLVWRLIWNRSCGCAATTRVPVYRPGPKALATAWRAPGGWAKRAADAGFNRELLHFMKTP